MPRLSRRSFATSLSCAAFAALAPARARSSQSSGAMTKALIDLSSNENPYGPSRSALEAMSAAQSVASRYPDAAEDRVREAIALHHAAKPEQVVIGCGSSEVLRLCDAAFLGPGRTVIAAEPTFEAVLHYAKVTRAEGLTLPLTPDFRHDLRAMAKACDARTGLVYVCNPNNPTGTIVRLDALTAFLEQVPNTAVVVVDEAYHHFVEDKNYGSVTGLVERFPNLVVARTFSKIYGMAGMRLGYAIASEKNAEAMRAQASWSTVNIAVLEAGLACLKDPELPRQQRALLNGSRHALCRALEKDGRRYIPSETNFLMIDVGADVEPLIPAFAAKGIKVGRRFAAMPQWLRVTIGKPEETEAFYRALGELVPAKAAA